MRNVLILEDNEACQGGLKEIVSSLNKDLKVHTASNIRDAENIMKQYIIDLFLIDINLNVNDGKDCSGITFARRIRKIRRYELTNIAFITALGEYELDSYREFYHSKFIRKPWKEEEVREVVWNLLKVTDKVSRFKKRFTFQINGITHAVNIGDILYMESGYRDVEVCCENDTFTLKRCSLDKALRLVDSAELVQCNRTVAVNRLHIKNIDEVNLYVTLSNKMIFTIGRTYKYKFLRDVEYGSYI